jgi:hypothetical protein
MIQANVVKERVHAIIEALPDDELMTLFDFAQYLADREAHGSLLQAQMQSSAYQEWVGEDNDIYDEVFANEPAAG